MDIYEMRFFRLFRDPRTPGEVAEQFADLRHVLFSALQEIETLKRLLSESNVVSLEDYKRARLQVMLDDHSSQGASPWKSHSQYAYTLDEIEYAREALKLSPSEIEHFQKDAAAMEMMT